MTYKPRTPPALRIPEPARWIAVLRIEPEKEIWILNLGTAFPYHYFYVPCKLANGVATTTCKVPVVPEELRNDERSIKYYGGRYFWSESDELLIVHCVSTSEYASQPSDVTQVVLGGFDLRPIKTLEKADILFLPNDNFREVSREIKSQ